MKIVHVITGLGLGGAERMLSELVKVTSNNGDDVVVVSLLDLGVFGESIASCGVKIHTLNMKSVLGLLGARVRLKKILDLEAPDVIHAWMYHAALLLSWTRPKLPMIWGIHHSLESPKREKLFLQIVIFLLKKLSRKPEKIVYCSNTSKHQHERYGFHESSSLTVPNGFDIESYRPYENNSKVLRSQLKIPSGAFVVGHIGRYHPMKDHRNFIAAAAKLLEKDQNIHFVLAGPSVDQDNKELVEVVDEFGVQENVHLLGPRSDVVQLYGLFDILSTSSSYGEAFPMVLGEAMACGCPCVATDVGDCAFLIGETGKVVPPRDPQALCEAWHFFCKLTQLERDQLGNAARQKVINEFSVEKVSKDFVSVYVESIK